VAKLQQSVYDFAALHGIKVVPAGEGIAHHIFDELGYVKPGALLIGGDSHTTSYGYLGCIAAGMGASDMAMAMCAGSLWFKVPHTIRVNFSGAMKPDISGKDVALKLVGLIGASGANYLAVEFGGDGIASLSMNDRWVICNMLAECGAKCGIMPLDEIAVKYCSDRELDISGAEWPDLGCNYIQTLDINLAEIGHMIAVPHSPADCVELKTLAGLKVDMVLIGTCTNGHLSDFEEAHRMMRCHDGPFIPETLVIPGSRKIYLELMNKNIVADFLDRGAIILPPACGPCCGSSPGVPRDGFTVLSTANRNFMGRMGNTSAKIYLASPIVAAAAALAGKIIDPGEVARHAGI
jgi:3-isopropylmalate/(R)-2-methylmalate dehydratase large subunit